MLTRHVTCRFYIDVSSKGVNLYMKFRPFQMQIYASTNYEIYSLSYLNFINKLEFDLCDARAFFKKCHI